MADYRIRPNTGRTRFRVVRIGPRGGVLVLAVYADETSATKLVDLLVTQRRYETGE